MANGSNIEDSEVQHTYTFHHSKINTLLRQANSHERILFKATKSKDQALQLRKLSEKYISELKVFCLLDARPTDRPTDRRTCLPSFLLLLLRGELVDHKHNQTPADFI